MYKILASGYFSFFIYKRLQIARTDSVDAVTLNFDPLPSK